jgi:hypothetical protein
MANPTTNYGFVLPTATDLVTDLPADFDVALQGVDTRLKALQPGTTLGDIAYSSATANTNTRLGVGTTGQVLTVASGVPSWATPASTAFVGVSLEMASQTLSNNTDTYLSWTTEKYDTDGFHSTVTNTSRITIPTGQGGYYEFRWSLMFASNVNGNRRFRLVKNAAGYDDGPILTVGSTNSGLVGMCNSTVVETIAGDYWEIQAFQDSGGSLATGAIGNLFQATKVG